MTFVFRLFQLPMVLKVPRLNSSPLALCDRPFSLLGFGDILVPGKRWDIPATCSERRFYCCLLQYTRHEVIFFFFFFCCSDQVCWLCTVTGLTF